MDSDRLKELQDAIETLERFTASSSGGLDFDIDDSGIVLAAPSPLRKTLSLAKRLLTLRLFPEHSHQHAIRRDLSEDKLLQSIDVIKNHHLFLARLQQGTPAQRRLAGAAAAAIDRFNALVDGEAERSSTLRRRIKRFLYQRIGLPAGDSAALQKIEFPTPITVRSSSPTSAIAEKVALAASTPSSQKVAKIAAPLTTEVDAFRMKALTMIRQHAVPSPSITEAMRHLREVPIATTMAGGSPFENNMSSSIISFRQTLTPFPGEVIKVVGAFQRSAASRVTTIPIPDSFHLSSQSTQTGFPHPTQHTGWALSDTLIPGYPLRPALAPLLDALNEQKRQTAYALLPDGAIIDNARAILKGKKLVFDSEAATFLRLHARFAVALVAGDPAAQRCCEAFFCLLEQCSSPYGHLSLTNQMVLELFVEQPFDRVRHQWLDNPDTFAQCAKTHASALFDEGITTAQSTIEKQRRSCDSELDAASSEYISTTGPVIASAARAIALQQLSENIGFAPPQLSDFDRRIQAATYKQLTDFLQEVQHPWKDSSDDAVGEHLLRLLEGDIALFTAEDPSTACPQAALVVDELASYYHTRHCGQDCGQGE